MARILSSIDNKGQALAETAILLSLLCVIFLGILTLSGRYEGSFNAFILARNTAWTGKVSDCGDNYTGKITFIKFNKRQISAEEQNAATGLIKEVTGKDLGTNMLCAEIKPLVFEQDWMPEIPAYAQKVCMLSDTWETHDPAAISHHKARDFMGEYLMGASRYKELKQ